MAPLLQLSEELLLLIIEECTVDTLRRLRLTHPKFAHSKFLKTHLFSTFVLKPSTPEDTLQFLAPYVHEVIFRTGTISTDPQSEEAASKDPVLWNLAPSLHILTNTQRVTISNPSYKHMGPRMVYRLNLYDKTPGLDDQFFRCALASIKHVSPKLLHLSIEHAAHYRFRWHQKFTEFRDLDLSGLRTLHFHPYYIAYDLRDAMRLSDFSVAGETTPEPDATLTKLLHKCSSNLQELSVRSPALYFGESWGSEFHWQSGPPPVFPALTKISIEGGNMSFEHVLPWLHQCTGLQQLILTRMDCPHPRSLTRWRPLFDAIRTHPNDRLRAQLTRLRCDRSPQKRWRISLTYDPSQPMIEEEEEQNRDIVAHLKDYLSNSRDWPTQEEIDEAYASAMPHLR